MSYPKTVTITKLNTLDNADVPQKERFPDGWYKKGIMWERSKPTKGSIFVLYQNKLYPTFFTSTIQEIIDESEDTITFRTNNSTYKILIQNEE